MQLTSLDINNFRQFYGKQRIVLSKNKTQPITVIHGENGSGKTALLNAFKWVLYGKTDFDTQEKLLNERIAYECSEGGISEVTVTLNFLYNDKNYQATRTQKYKKYNKTETNEQGGNIFVLKYIDLDGKFINSHNPDTEIKQIIPEDLHSYFFFNGERIDKLANSSSSNEIRLAVKKMLGIEVIERAEKHLFKYVIKSFKNKLKEVAPDDLNKKLESENEEQTRLSSVEQELKCLKNNSSEFEKELNEIDKNLKDKKEIADLHKERLVLEDNLKILKNKRKEILLERKKCISKKGFLVFTDRIIQQTEHILEEKRKKGELPSNIKEQFIKDLLEAKECICGHKLIEGTEEYKKINSYLETAIPQDVENAYINTSGAIKSIKKDKQVIFNKFEEFEKRISSIDNENKVAYGRLDVIIDKIGMNKSEDIEKLEIRREKLKNNIKNTLYEIGALQQEAKDIRKRIDMIHKEIKESKSKSAEQELAQKKLDLANESLRVVQDIYKSISDSVKRKLSEKVNNTFTSIMRKSYWAEISDDYYLNVFKKIGDQSILVSEKSTGENQVASLSFISSIVSLCKENYQENKKNMKGGVFPIVMDSPYGALDKEYRALVAKVIPELADQIIILVSDSQWSGEVEEEIISKVGKRYTLMYHAPNISETTKCNSVVKDEYEFTEIKEGYYGR